MPPPDNSTSQPINPTAQAPLSLQDLALKNMPSVATDLPSEWQNIGSSLSGNNDDVANYLANRHPNSKFFTLNGAMYQTTPEDMSNINNKDDASRAIAKGYAYKIDPGFIADSVAGVLPTAATIAGATGGAAAFTPGGPAAVAGGIAGAGAGNVAGHIGNQWIANKVFGVPNTNDYSPGNSNFAPFDPKATTYNRLMPINFNSQTANDFVNGAAMQGMGEAVGLGSLGLGKINPSLDISTNLSNQLPFDLGNKTAQLGDQSINLSEIAKGNPVYTKQYNNALSDQVQKVTTSIVKPIQDALNIAGDNSTISKGFNIIDMVSNGASDSNGNVNGLPITPTMQSNWQKIQPLFDKLLDDPNLSDNLKSNLKSQVGDGLQNLADLQNDFNSINEQLGRNKTPIIGNIGDDYAKSGVPNQPYGVKFNYQASGPQLGSTLSGQIMGRTVPPIYNTLKNNGLLSSPNNSKPGLNPVRLLQDKLSQ